MKVIDKVQKSIRTGMTHTMFMSDVKNMKAWQLYTGQSIWFFVIGIVFFLVRVILVQFQPSPSVMNTYGLVEKIGTGRADAEDGSEFAKSLLSS